MYERRRTPQLVGHRGYPALQPDNTVPSAVAAHAAGADMIEIDVNVTADGFAVAIHGPNLESSTDGTGPIAEVDLAVIRRLTAKRAGEVVEGVGVPLVAELLDAVPDAAFNLDLKSDAALEAVLDLIESRNLQRRCVISGCNALRVGRVRRSRTEVGVLINLNRFDVVMARSRLGPWWLSTRYWRLLRCRDVVALNVSHRLVSERLVERITRIGSEVWTYTVDDPERMHVLRAMGVSSITTNRIGDAPDLG